MARPKNPQRTSDLLDAAAQVLQARGIAGVTLRPLAAELGVSPRTLLYHFGSKEKLITQAIRHLRHQQPTLAKALAPDQQPSTGAVALGEVVRSMWEEQKQEQARPFLALYFELAALAIRDPDTYGTMLHELDHEWTDAITSHLQTRGLDAHEAASRMKMLMIRYRGALHYGLVTGNWDAADAAIHAAVGATDV